MNWQDFWDSLFCGHYKKLYLDTLNSLEVCVDDRLTCLKQKHKLEQENEQLKLLVPRPPPPAIDYVVEKDTIWVQKVISGLGANLVRLPLGAEFRLTNKESFLEFIAWDWVDSFEYHKFYRCGNFSISFKASSDQWGVNQVGIVLDYKAGHAYNLIIFPNGKVMLLEPQSDSLFYCEDRVTILYVLKDAFVLI